MSSHIEELLLLGGDSLVLSRSVDLSISAVNDIAATHVLLGGSDLVSVQEEGQEGNQQSTDQGNHDDPCSAETAGASGCGSRRSRDEWVNTLRQLLSTDVAGVDRILSNVEDSSLVN